jgi:hypothetical protein
MEDSDKNIQSDYEFSRATYYNLIMKGQEALDGMMEVAASTEHPRAYEVLGNIIKSVSDVNDKLMDLNKKKKEINRKEELQKHAIPATTNNLFVGSTTDLQRLLLDATQSVKVINHNGD